MSQRKLYDSAYLSTQDVSHNETPYVFEKRLDKVLYLLEPQKNGLYLDVGCGDGRFEKLLKDYRIIGTEISYVAIRGKKDALCYTLSDGRELPFTDNSFDGIICSEIIEHMPSKSDVKFILKELVRVCKPGKSIVITTPNENSLLDVIKYFLTGKRNIDPLHASLLSEGKLRFLLSELPVEIVSFERYFISLPIPRYEWALPKILYKYLYYIGKLLPIFCFGFIIKLEKVQKTNT